MINFKKQFVLLVIHYHTFNTAVKVCCKSKPQVLAVQVHRQGLSLLACPVKITIENMRKSWIFLELHFIISLELDEMVNIAHISVHLLQGYIYSNTRPVSLA